MIWYFVCSLTTKFSGMVLSLDYQVFDQVSQRNSEFRFDSVLRRPEGWPVRYWKYKIIHVYVCLRCPNLIMKADIWCCIGDPLPFITEFVESINVAIREYDENRRLSSTQRYRISFCIMAIIMTDTVCRAAFERAGLGTYALAALSWMLRHSKIPWEFLLCSSISHILKGYGITEGTLALDDSEKSVPKIRNEYRMSIRWKIKRLTDIPWDNQ